MHIILGYCNIYNNTKRKMNVVSERREDELPGREYALLTDLYQLTMNASYLDNKKGKRAGSL